MNQIKTFFRFRCTKRKGKYFLLCKTTKITNKRYVIFNKKKFIFDNIDAFVEACPNQKCQRILKSLVVELIC